MFLNYFALGVLIFVFLVIFYGIIAIHDIPYLIAKCSAAKFFAPKRINLCTVANEQKPRLRTVQIKTPLFNLIKKRGRKPTIKSGYTGIKNQRNSLA